MKALPLTFFLCAAQLQPQTAFEVAVVKPNDPSSPVASGTMFSPTRLRATGSLRSLIELAYGVREYEILNGPPWLGSSSFAIDAKADHPATQAQLKRMLQTLLADRFKLRLHEETREVPLYALIVSKKGSKLREVSDNVGNMSAGPGFLKGNLALPALAQNLTSTLGRTVEDRTGLAGAYEIQLNWTPEEIGPSSDSTGRPSLFSAI